MGKNYEEKNVTALAVVLTILILTGCSSNEPASKEYKGDEDITVNEKIASIATFALK